MRMEPGEFSPTTKRRLAGEAGHVCSAPWCDKSTTAASGERKSGLSSTAEAAHIKGRRPDAARYDSNMTDPERADASNGIHLCRSDAKLIDDDEAMYPVALLEQWKARQLENARAAQQQGWGEEQACDLMSHTTKWLEVDVDGIYDHLRAAGMTSAWPFSAADDIATLLAELALNARRHARCCGA